MQILRNMQAWICSCEAGIGQLLENSGGTFEEPFPLLPIALGSPA
jgi:hypothetical protein